MGSLGSAVQPAAVSLLSLEHQLRAWSGGSRHDKPPSQPRQAKPRQAAIIKPAPSAAALPGGCPCTAPASAWQHAALPSGVSSRALQLCSHLVFGVRCTCMLQQDGTASCFDTCSALNAACAATCLCCCSAAGMPAASPKQCVNRRSTKFLPQSPQAQPEHTARYRLCSSMLRTSTYVS